ncbi:hypothetical protein GPJ56_001079 [Histomonas meleagridis]|uniref:uncharacterized protein n=1 Tax=Histomonas meleagridis TaxID=135588 RepID=UPI003559E7C0|nr:hypothetical protein GPJ56_001079 [Histomonas meleagridis]KAH0801734.1 hypothetical protein GO595_005415 [Histomonas meleagridis]
MIPPFKGRPQLQPVPFPQNIRIQPQPTHPAKTRKAPKKSNEKFTGSNIPTPLTPAQSKNAINRIISSLSNDRLSIIEKVFNISAPSREASVDCFFSVILPEIEKMSNNNIYPSLISFFELLQKGTQEQLSFFFEPKIPFIFRQLPESKRHIQFLRYISNVFTYNLPLTPCESDPYVIGQLFTVPNCILPKANVQIDETEITPVTFGEEKLYYFFGRRSKIHNQSKILVQLESPNTLCWFSITVVIPKNNIIQELMKKQAIDCSSIEGPYYGYPLVCGCKKPVQSFDVEKFIAQVIETGVSSCPKCNRSILINEITFDVTHISQKQQKAPFPVPSIPVPIHIGAKRPPPKRPPRRRNVSLEKGEDPSPAPMAVPPPSSTATHSSSSASMRSPAPMAMPLSSSVSMRSSAPMAMPPSSSIVMSSSSSMATHSPASVSMHSPAPMAMPPSSSIAMSSSSSMAMHSPAPMAMPPPPSSSVSMHSPASMVMPSPAAMVMHSPAMAMPSPAAMPIPMHPQMQMQMQMQIQRLLPQETKQQRKRKKVAGEVTGEVVRKGPKKKRERKKKNDEIEKEVIKIKEKDGKDKELEKDNAQKEILQHQQKSSDEETARYNEAKFKAFGYAYSHLNDDTDIDWKKLNASPRIWSCQLTENSNTTSPVFGELEDNDLYGI